MTNYDILKEYEAHQTPVPSYNEWKRILHYASRYEFEYTSCAMDYENLKEENEQLKELLQECELWFTGIVGNMNDKDFGENNRNLPIGNFEYALKVFSQKINQTLGEDK